MTTLRVLATLALAVITGTLGCANQQEKKESTQSVPVQVQAPPSPPPPVAQVPVAAPAPVKTEVPLKGKQGSKGGKGVKGAKQVVPVSEDAAPPVAPPPPASDKSPPPAAGKIGPGMNARGEVVDSTKVESGYGQRVKGMRDYEGEITGRPAPGSKFIRLQIGMPLKQVTDLIGQPSDEGTYMTGKAFIPFFFGGDRHRQELVYKGQGRLIFAGGSIGDLSGANLIWIIHNANEPAYR